MKKAIILIAAMVATLNLFSQSNIGKAGISIEFEYSSNSERCLKNKTFFDYYSYGEGQYKERLLKITSDGGVTKDLRYKVIVDPLFKVTDNVMKVTFLTDKGTIIVYLPYKDESKNHVIINNGEYYLANKPINCQSLLVEPVKKQSKK